MSSKISLSDNNRIEIEIVVSCRIRSKLEQIWKERVPAVSGLASDERLLRKRMDYMD